MQTLTALGGVLSLIGFAAIAWRRSHLREITYQRSVESPADAHAARDTRPRSVSALRRHRLVPWCGGLLVSAAVWILTPLGSLFALAFGVMAGLLGSQLEQFLAVRRAAQIEAQLADAIDLMVGALGAGAGMIGGIEGAVREASQPLRAHLEETLGRIRYGDDAPTAFASLAERVPLETFLLFSATLAAQWEVGGSLAPTLSAVGRTVRDRIELARRVRSNLAQSQFSTIVVVLITYFIAAVIWRTNPDQMAEFLQTSGGQAFVAGTVVLQGIGVLWMNALSRVRF